MRSAIREAIETIALAVFLVLLIQATVQNYQVNGPSMDPTLADQDRVLVNRVVYTEIEAERVGRFTPGFDPNRARCGIRFTRRNAATSLCSSGRSILSRTSSSA